MKATRLANRILMAMGIMTALSLLCAEMETLTTAQFVTAKLGAAVLGWAIWKRTMQLDREGKI